MFTLFLISPKLPDQGGVKQFIEGDERSRDGEVWGMSELPALVVEVTAAKWRSYKT